MSCNKCGQYSCGCQTKFVPAGCMESVNHGDTINMNTGPALELLDAFAIPACNEIGVMKVAGYITAPPSGTYAYVTVAGEVARLRVTSVTKFAGSIADGGSDCNSACGPKKVYTSQYAYTEVKVVNDCLACDTLAAGTFVDKGTSILFTAPDCAVIASGSSDLVLCDQLHIPDVGESVEVSVSPSTSSLSIGDIVQITDKRFRVSAIPSAQVLELTNDGEGGNPGDIINGSDCLSIRIFKIAGDNPCEKTAVAEGDSALVCKDSQIVPLDMNDGEVVGQVGGVIVGVPLPVDNTVLTPISNCVTLDPANTSGYTVMTASLAGFVVGDIVYFDCDPFQRTFTIISITGPNAVVKPCEVPTIVETIAVACEGDPCNLVLADCCKQCAGGLIQYGINTYSHSNLDFQPVQQYYDAAVIGTDVVTYTNTECCKQEILLRLDTVFDSVLKRGSVDEASGDLIAWLQESIVTLQVGVTPAISICGNTRGYDSLIDSIDKAGAAQSRRTFAAVVPATDAFSTLRSYPFLNKANVFSARARFSLMPGETANLAIRNILNLSDNWASMDWGATANNAKTTLEYSFFNAIYIEGYGAK